MVLNHLRKKRMDLGWTILEAAQHLKVSKTALGSWERDEHEIRIRFYPRIIEFLGYIPFEIGESQGEKLLAYRKIRGIICGALRRMICGGIRGKISRAICRISADKIRCRIVGV